MNKGVLKNVVISFLLGMAIFIVVRHILVVREKNILVDTLNQKREEIAVLQKDNQELKLDLAKEKELQQLLVKQKGSLRVYLEAARRRLAGLFKGLGKAKSSIRELDGRISILKAENQALLEENRAYKSKFSSAAELKKAMEDIRSGPYSPAEGNRGFLIKDGKINTPNKVIIEVVPAPAKE